MATDGPPSIDREQVRKVLDVLDAHLTVLSRETGLAVSLKKTRYSDSNIEIVIQASTRSANGVVMNTDAESFVRLAGEFGLSPDDLGRQLKIGERCFRIVGLRPRARLPVVCERTDRPGEQRSRFDHDLIRQLLVDSSKAPAQLRLVSNGSAAPAAGSATAAGFYRFHVQILGIKPPIYRRFHLRSTATFQDLHLAIQDAFGWSQSHMFVFQDERRGGAPIAGMPDSGNDLEPDDPNAKTLKLASWFRAGQKRCFYIYDFGDDWTHEVKLEGMNEIPGVGKRMLLDGARACPPEDCGGLPGYEECVEVATTGRDQDGRKEWLGDWQPEEFNLAKKKVRFDR